MRREAPSLDEIVRDIAPPRDSFGDFDLGPSDDSMSLDEIVRAAPAPSYDAWNDPSTPLDVAALDAWENAAPFAPLTVTRARPVSAAAIISRRPSYAPPAPCEEHTRLIVAPPRSRMIDAAPVAYVDPAPYGAHVPHAAPVAYDAHVPTLAHAPAGWPSVVDQDPSQSRNTGQLAWSTPPSDASRSWSSPNPATNPAFAPTVMLRPPSFVERLFATPFAASALLGAVALVIALVAVAKVEVDAGRERAAREQAIAAAAAPATQGPVAPVQAPTQSEPVAVPSPTASVAAAPMLTPPVAGPTFGAAPQAQITPAPAPLARTTGPSTPSAPVKLEARERTTPVPAATPAKSDTTPGFHVSFAVPASSAKPKPATKSARDASIEETLAKLREEQMKR